MKGEYSNLRFKGISNIRFKQIIGHVNLCNRRLLSSYPRVISPPPSLLRFFVSSLFLWVYIKITDQSFVCLLFHEQFACRPQRAAYARGWKRGGNLDQEFADMQ